MVVMLFYVLAIKIVLVAGFVKTVGEQAGGI
jgi:hypothetical protein